MTSTAQSVAVTSAPRSIRRIRRVASPPRGSTEWRAWPAHEIEIIVRNDARAVVIVVVIVVELAKALLEGEIGSGRRALVGADDAPTVEVIHPVQVRQRARPVADDDAAESPAGRVGPAEGGQDQGL